VALPEESKPGQDMRPLREQFAERRALIESSFPAETQAVHRQVVEGPATFRESAKRTLQLWRQSPGVRTSDHTESQLPQRTFSPVAASSLLHSRTLDPFCCGQL